MLRTTNFKKEILLHFTLSFLTRVIKVREQITDLFNKNSTIVIIFLSSTQNVYSVGL